MTKGGRVEFCAPFLHTVISLEVLAFAAVARAGIIYPVTTSGAGGSHVIMSGHVVTKGSSEEFCAPLLRASFVLEVLILAARAGPVSLATTSGAGGCHSGMCCHAVAEGRDGLNVSSRITVCAMLRLATICGTGGCHIDGVFC